ncbi:hypothetical protein SUGI_1041690 [Cryptomeria japonica]|uniref:RING-H2 finger protein ATL70 n=1 Tax=Cryptomeria japonica TaxID=3369 RepID=UPI002414B9D4|nr:RING-H2 finger protein ATL70 [Cryptomeria japonica]GLJ49288.1 hypothetical protein SUGI_1041690 [Cryptomeria japonica]
MNGSSTDGGNSSSGSELGRLGLSYGIVISVGTMAVLTIILMASYVCIRLRLSRARTHGDPIGVPAEMERGEIGHGLDQATLDGYPKMVYSEKRGSKAEKDCCSICLTDYVDEDVVRIMPDCAHIFHVACVDEWLRRHPTCPVCRVASPMTTPLSEFIPLARNDSLRRT